MSRSVAKGIALIAVAVLVIVGLLVMPAKRGPKQHPPNDDPWVLVNYNPDDPYGTYLGNGFISTRIMGDGVGSQDGKPLPCYMAGFYDDEKLIPIPTWSDLRFYDGKTRFKIDKDADYKQVLDMRTGILTTHATWRAGRKTLKGKIEVIVSRAQPDLCLLQAELTPSFDGRVGALGQATHSGQGLRFWTSSVESDQYGAPVVSCWETRDSRTGGARRQIAVVSCLDSDVGDWGALAPTSPPPGDRITCSAKRGVPFSVRKYGSVWSDEQMRYFALANLVRGMVPGLEDAIHDPAGVVSRHKAAWAKLWQSDIAIDGPRKDQQVIHSCMFYLLQSAREGSKWSIPPLGLSSNAYGGHIFWDADIWMFPALILQHPELAKSIVDYRYETLSGAIANAKAAGMPGAQYAWESGYTGKEDTPPGLVYRQERHINGDVALAQWQFYLATGDLNWLRTRGYPVIKATADWWVAKAKFVPDKKRYEILQVCPPDESADIINNSAYTNAIAQMNLEIACRAAKLLSLERDSESRSNERKWSEVASKLYIPFDAKNRRFIAFDEDGSGGRFNERYKAKQADVELLAYPLQYKIPGQNMTDIYKNTLAFYSPRVHRGGPAMTSSAYSVIQARLGDCPKAYSEFTASYKPYLRGPFNCFNEQPSKFKDNLCFLTGAAGPIQAVNFGLAGAHIDYFGNPDLTFKPCLPKQWKSLKLTNVHWRGKTFDVTITPSGVKTGKGL